MAETGQEKTDTELFVIDLETIQIVRGQTVGEVATGVMSYNPFQLYKLIPDSGSAKTHTHL